MGTHNDLNSQKLDQWLDEALRKYGDVEPRAGLERRILANLRGEDVTHWRWSWRWSFAAAMILILAIAGVSVWLTGAHSHQTLVSNESARPTPVAIVQDSSHQHPVSVQTGAARRNRHIRPARELAVKQTPEPMLAQFPSARPLSEQERLLKEYVTQFPDQAKLVAEEQTATQKEMDQLYADNTQKEVP